jgi:hypothetical protein
MSGPRGMDMRTKFVTAAFIVAAVAGTSLGQVTPDKPTTPGTQSGQPDQPGKYGQPGMDRPGMDQQGNKLSKDDVDKFTRGWDQEQLQAVRTLISKYGPPDGGTMELILWNNPRPMGRDSSPGATGGASNQFKKIIVHKEPVDHRFPKPHKDFLETIVAFKVPVDKISEIADFDGSIMVNRTRGTVSSTCNSEEANILALNVAHDIASGEKSASEARDFFTKTIMAFKEGGEKPQAVTVLLFRPDPNAADAGTPGRVLGTPEMPDRDKDKLDPNKPGLDKPKNNDPEIPRSTNPNNPR